MSFTDEEINLWKGIDDEASKKFVIMDNAKKNLQTMPMKYFENRPIFEKILVLPERSAINFKYDQPWAAISITSHPEEVPIPETNRKHLLRMNFADLSKMGDGELKLSPEAEARYGPLFTQEMARKIWDFADSVWNEIDLLVIHCHAGLSRSPGVALTLSEVYQPKWVTYIEALYNPNSLVVDLMRKNRH